MHFKRDEKTLSISFFVQRLSFLSSFTFIRLHSEGERQKVMGTQAKTGTLTRFVLFYLF